MRKPMEHIYITTTKRNPKGKWIYFIRQRHTEDQPSYQRDKERVQNGEEASAFEDSLQSYGWIGVKVRLSFSSFVFWII